MVAVVVTVEKMSTVVMEVKVDVEWEASTRPGMVDVSVTVTVETLRKVEQKGPAVFASRRPTTLETELVVQNG